MARNRHAWAAVLALLLGSAPALRAEGPATGEWTLSGYGPHVSLEANEASINEILSGLRDLTGARVRFGTVPERKVSCRTGAVTLDTLLRQLDVSYFLTYADEGAGDPRLEGAWISFFERTVPAAAPRSGPLADIVFSKDQPIPYRLQRILREGTPDGGPGPALVAGEEYRAAMPVQVLIDGNTDDWPEWIPWQESALGLVDAVWGESTDAAFAVAAAADEESMYFGVRVRDDRLAAADAEPLRTGPDDQLRFSLQTRNADGTLADPTVITMRRHHVFLVDPSDPTRLVPGTRQVVRNSQGVSAVIVSGDDGWFIEMGIPFERLGVDTKAGPPLFDFDVLLEDRDVEKTEPQHLAWSRANRLGPNAAGGDPGLLRVLDFRGFPAE